MYIICTYDVDAKRCVKVMKLLRKYLFHVQNSVFEGELTPVKMKELKEQLSSLVSEDDSIIFFYAYENKAVNKESLGKPLKNTTSII